MSLELLYPLEEMMIRFSGRSKETHRIKNKPIGEGYKFFVLTTNTGFVINFTPDGRTAATTGEQEYSLDKKIGKIESMILFVVGVIENFRFIQKERIEKYEMALRSRTTQTKASKEEVQKQLEDVANPMNEFCLAMDNYFTLPKVLQVLRGKNIGVVGTSRFRKNWPPKNLQDVNQNSARFNSFFHTVDEYGNLVARWMDNGLVFCVSTLHKVGEVIKRKRKRPRKTLKNKKTHRRSLG